MIALASVALAQGATPAIPLEQGLVFTVTSHTSFVSQAGSAPVADTEIVYQVLDAGAADRIMLQFQLGASNDATTNQVLQKSQRQFARIVRREDLQSALRESALFSSAEPQLMPGQTFATTSAAVLKSLHDTGKVAFVFGVNEPDGGLGALSAAAASLAPANRGAPVVFSGVQALLGGGARHYYRGTLERVGATDEAFPVLINGERATVPAVHVRGEMRFTDRALTPELWWLDDAANPLTLKWSAEGAYEVVTRIDLPTAGAGTESGGRLKGHIEAALADKASSCRAELAGVYFATGSAQVLDPSLPALQRFASLMTQHSDWIVTIEGHTDNIGSADYNMDLSTRRANSVREILVRRFNIASGRLQAKGYGLTRPVDSNATDLGRAHNRRVEVSRGCG